VKLSFPRNLPAELRPIEDSDAEQLFALVDGNRQHLRQWLPWLDGNTSLADTVSFIRSAREQQLHNRGFQAGIWYNRSMAGIIGYHPIDWQNRIVMIGYWLGEAFQGKGIMTESSRILVHYAFDEYQMNRVEIRCAEENARSRAIPERLGFVQEGRIGDGEWLYDHFVDLIVYRMLAREWNVRR
jgi:ribosomal-protein-serine acetyltransferase